MVLVGIIHDDVIFQLMTMKMMTMTKARAVEVGGGIEPQNPMAIMPQPSLRPQQGWSSTSLSLKEVCTDYRRGELEADG
jgi:hypothetical protein